MFAFTTHHVVIEVPERISDCPVSKPFKNFPPPPPKKKPRNTHDEGMRLETQLALRIWCYHGEAVHGSFGGRNGGTNTAKSNRITYKHRTE